MKTCIFNLRGLKRKPRLHDCQAKAERLLSILVSYSSQSTKELPKIASIFRLMPQLMCPDVMAISNIRK